MYHELTESWSNMYHGLTESWSSTYHGLTDLRFELFYRIMP